MVLALDLQLVFEPVDDLLVARNLGPQLLVLGCEVRILGLDDSIRSQ